MTTSRVAAWQLDHLLQGGRRRIAFLGGYQQDPEVHDRHGEYEAALRAGGVEADPDLATYSHWTEESGRTAMEELLDRGPDLDAVFACSDVLAIAAVSTCSASVAVASPLTWAWSATTTSPSRPSAIRRSLRPSARTGRWRGGCSPRTSCSTCTQASSRTCPSRRSSSFASPHHLLPFHILATGCKNLAREELHMMHPPTALPRSLAEHINPPPVFPIVRDRPHAGGANERPPSLLARLFRRGGRQSARRDAARRQSSMTLSAGSSQPRLSDAVDHVAESHKR